MPEVKEAQPSFYLFTGDPEIKPVAYMQQQT